MDTINYKDFYNKVGVENGWNFDTINCITEGEEWDFYSEVSKCLSKESLWLDIGIGGGEKVLKIADESLMLIRVDSSDGMISTANMNLENSGKRNARFHKMDAIKKVLKQIGTKWITSEDMYPSIDLFIHARNKYSRLNVGQVNAAFNYVENRGAPNFSVLTDDEIDNVSKRLGPHGNKVLVLARGYTKSPNDWVTPIKRALNNPKVSGVVLELASNIEPETITHERVSQLIKDTLAKKKQFYYLVPKMHHNTKKVYGEYLLNQMKRLHEEGIDFKNNNIFLVSADYNDANKVGDFYDKNNTRGNSVEAGIALYKSIQRNPTDPSKWNYNVGINRKFSIDPSQDNNKDNEYIDGITDSSIGEDFKYNEQVSSFEQSQSSEYSELVATDDSMDNMSIFAKILFIILNFLRKLFM